MGAFWLVAQVHDACSRARHSETLVRARPVVVTQDDTAGWITVLTWIRRLTPLPDGGYMSVARSPAGMSRSSSCSDTRDGVALYRLVARLRYERSL